MQRRPGTITSTSPPESDRRRSSGSGGETRDSGGAEIDLISLTKTYESGDVRALDDVSARLAPGEFVTFLGPSGAGKTSVLRLLAGLEFPDRGQVLLNGRDVTSVPPQRREMGVVFQDYALFPHMTVYQNCAFPLQVRRVPAATIRQTVDAVLNTVQLGDHGDRYPAQLSGGQKQRVAIARTLVYEPQVLLMDEPLGALDKNLREHMQLELRQLQQRLGVTCVYVTHDQDEAMALSDRIAVMRDGRIEQMGSPRDLYRNPRSQFVAGFFGKMNFIPGEVTGSDSDCVHVDTELGVVRASRESARLSQGSLTAGAPVTVAVRPEKVSVTASPPRGTAVNSLALTVEYIRYAGAFTYVDGVGRTRETGVVACKGPENSDITTGEPAAFHFPVENTFVFEREPADQRGAGKPE
ncbi:ABC transporter ATP-binding protein [Actinobacteria bacterium YIM 96077]|uniref:Spermidine/putrescine import ATP-binding protein PotA n=1 Tax=Phytoactinopolyspora halophila TaxID=1981511 RepID=A0A329QCD9_9ACTN|nr:ABC transporter ATP-binding protein [Phytoactinopolyspora halophila]AYY13936.1 ABC transporter ATP-binding protein [Actinobacteria bacterium YIM 96077]RAW10065.1 polyamine ABC transporter ATP-binding protein [Phytoactinopolyspora halophila]